MMTPNYRLVCHLKVINMQLKSKIGTGGSDVMQLICNFFPLGFKANYVLFEEFSVLDSLENFLKDYLLKLRHRIIASIRRTESTKFCIRKVK